MNDFYMIDKKSDIVNVGYPLDSISKYKECDKFFSEMTPLEKLEFKSDESHVIDFINKSLKKIKKK